MLDRERRRERVWVFCERESLCVCVPESDIFATRSRKQVQTRNVMQSKKGVINIKTNLNTYIYAILLPSTNIVER